MDNKILTAEQEMKLRAPIDERVGAIQKKIDDLREDGTNKVLAIQSEIDSEREITFTQKQRKREGLKNTRRNWNRQERSRQKIRLRSTALSPRRKHS